MIRLWSSGLCLAGLILVTLPAPAQIWTGLGPDNDWSTATNWNPAAVPANDGSAALTSAQLDQIFFINPFGLPSGTYAARILASGEIVPVPEPSVLLTLFLLLTWALWRERHARLARPRPSLPSGQLHD